MVMVRRSKLQLRQTADGLSSRSEGRGKRRRDSALRKITVLIVTGAIGMACAGTTGPEQPNFGAQYRVVLEPDPPVLAAGSLSVTVSYGGCGNNRDFVLEHRIRMDAADIWLHKITPDESCDMLVTERRTFAIPAPVRYVATVTLLTRDHEPLQLRP